jgi:hypothetical protein
VTATADPPGRHEALAAPVEQGGPYPLAPVYDGTVSIVAIPPRPATPARAPAERIAHVMAAVDGRPWETLLPQPRAALGEVWRMMDGDQLAESIGSQVEPDAGVPGRSRPEEARRCQR